AKVYRQAVLRILNLAILWQFVPELPHNIYYLCHPGRANGVAAGFQPARDVDRNLPAKASFSLQSRLSAFPLFKETYVFAFGNFKNSECIMKLSYVDIGRL